MTYPPPRNRLPSCSQATDYSCVARRCSLWNEPVCCACLKIRSVRSQRFRATMDDVNREQGLFAVEGRMKPVCLRLIAVVLLLAVTGCQSHTPLSSWGGMSPRSHSDVGPSIAPAADLPPEVESQQLVARRGSNLVPKEKPNADSAENVDPAMLVGILDELESLGLTKEESDQFKNDLKNADPAYWPMMMQTLRTTLAFREQRKPSSEKEDKEEGIDTLELVESEDPRPRVGSPGNWEPKPRDAMQPEVTQFAAQSTDGQAMEPRTQVPVRLPLSPEHAAVAANPVIAATANDPFFDDGQAAQLASPSSATQAPVQQVDYQTTPVDRAPVDNTHLSQRPTATAPETLPAAPSTNQNSTTTLNSTVAALEREVAEARASGDMESATQREIRLRMLYMLAHRNEDALRPIEGLDASQQDYWSQQLYALATYLDSTREPDPQRRAAAANEFLAEATDRLSELSELKVTGLAFCTEVVSFGVYKKFEEYKFQPGQQLLLYAEVDNFFSEATPKGHHTALRSSYELLDSRGQIVEEHQFDLTEEYCQNARRDFFIRYFLYMPQRIYDGDYTLRLTIEDTLGHKVGQATIDLSIAGR